MIEALLDYGLFLAKTLTLLLGGGFLLAWIFQARHQTRGSEEALDIQHLNAHYRDRVRQLKHASRPRKVFRQWLKAEKKSEKAKEKVEEKRHRLFVLDFHGDLKASEVASLREIVSTLLQESEEGDQVLVRLENAGGLVTEHGLAAAQLVRLRDRGLPLTVAVDKVAASGGYLMASVANRILAAPFAVLGSIGVVAQLPNFHRLLERHGVDYELHTAGDYKRTLTLFGENTAEGREKLRAQLEQTHALFQDFLHRYRPNLDLARVATGEYWHGEQALELGLIDALSTSDDFLLAEAKDYDLYRIGYRARKRPLERLLSSLYHARNRWTLS